MKKYRYDREHDRFVRRTDYSTDLDRQPLSYWWLLPGLALCSLGFALAPTVSYAAVFVLFVVGIGSFAALYACG